MQILFRVYYVMRNSFLITREGSLRRVDWFSQPIHPQREDMQMQNDFRKSAELAKRATTSISPAAAYKLLHESPNSLLIETRDPTNVPDEHRVDGSIIISMDKLGESSENSLNLAELDSRLEDKDLLIITT